MKTKLYLLFFFVYNPQNEKTVFPKRKRKVRSGKDQNESVQFHDTRTKIKQRLSTLQMVFKRCFFMQKKTQKGIANSAKFRIFTQPLVRVLPLSYIQFKPYVFVSCQKVASIFYVAFIDMYIRKVERNRLQR